LEDEDDKHIREIVAGRPDCTINYVRDEMAKNHWLSSAPTDKRVKKLIESGDIIDSKVGNSRHKLRINDRILYNRILRELEDIEVSADLMVEPLSKVHKIEQQDKFQAQSYHINLVGPFFNSHFAILRQLLELSKNNPAISKTNSAELTSKIMGLMEKIAYQPFHELDIARILDNQRGELEIFKLQLLQGRDKSVADVPLIETLIKKIDSYKERFL
jgi:hypothetical protein